MSNKKTSGTELSEDDIVSLLSSLRQEPHPEANFEDRFVHDFRERVARYAVTRPARKVLWEHILLRLTNIGKLKWACGATTLGVGVLAAGFFSWPSDNAAEQNRLAPAIGSARVVAKASPSDVQPVVVESSFELESSQFLLPTWNINEVASAQGYSFDTMSSSRIVAPSTATVDKAPGVLDNGSYIIYPGVATPVMLTPVQHKQITLPEE